MNRQESWQVSGLTLTLLRHITALGYTVSVHRLASSLLGSVPASVEMHAVDLATDPPNQHVARVAEGEADDPDYKCAVLLAEMVGIELEDG